MSDLLSFLLQVSTSEDTMVATLNFNVVKNEHFQDYLIKAENVAGTTEFKVTIKDGECKSC